MTVEQSDSGGVPVRDASFSRRSALNSENVMRRVRRTTSAAAVATAGLFMASILGVGVAPAGATTLSGKGVISLTQQALSKEKTLHYVVVDSRSNSKTVVTYAGNVGRSSGIQTITEKTKFGEGKATIIVIGSRSYVRGNLVGLRFLAAFPQNQVVGLVGKWIEVPSSDHSIYQNLAAAVTLPSVFNEVTLGGRLVDAGLVTVSGHEYYNLRATTKVVGTGSAVSTLLVSSSKPNLPFRYSVITKTAKQTETVHELFDRWGESLSVKAPAGAKLYKVRSTTAVI
jgi:hypothetical protein